MLLLKWTYIFNIPTKSNKHAFKKMYFIITNVYNYFISLKTLKNILGLYDFLMQKRDISLKNDE